MPTPQNLDAVHLTHLGSPFSGLGPLSGPHQVTEILRCPKIGLAKPTRCIQWCEAEHPKQGLACKSLQALRLGQDPLLVRADGPAEVKSGFRGPCFEAQWDH